MTRSKPRSRNMHKKDGNIEDIEFGYRRTSRCQQIFEELEENQ